MTGGEHRKPGDRAKARVRDGAVATGGELLLSFDSSRRPSGAGDQPLLLLQVTEIWDSGRANAWVIVADSSSHLPDLTSRSPGNFDLATSAPEEVSS
jgi:hypothetical protein